MIGLSLIASMILAPSLIGIIYDEKKLPEKSELADL
jgi:hypothetical protein